MNFKDTSGLISLRYVSPLNRRLLADRSSCCSIKHRPHKAHQGVSLGKIPIQTPRFLKCRSPRRGCKRSGSLSAQRCRCPSVQGDSRPSVQRMIKAVGCSPSFGCPSSLGRAAAKWKHDWIFRTASGVFTRT